MTSVLIRDTEKFTQRMEVEVVVSSHKLRDEDGHQKLEEARKRLCPRASGDSTVLPITISDFWSPEQWESPFLFVFF